MSENNPEYQVKQADEYLAEFERQSEYAWTKDEWMKAMDEETLLVPPTTAEQIEWFEQWFKDHPEAKAKLNADLIDFKVRMFDEKSLQSLLFRIWIEDNGKPTGLFRMLHKPNENYVKIRSIDTGNTYTLKL